MCAAEEKKQHTPWIPFKGDLEGFCGLVAHYTNAQRPTGALLIQLISLMLYSQADASTTYQQ